MAETGNPVVWFEIYVDDLDRARKFYETVLGVTLQKLTAPDGEPGIEMLAFPADPHGPGAGGALCKMPGFTAGRNGVVVYFHSEDCAVEAARVEAAGGRIQKEKMSIGPYGFIALAHDTEGNMFGIHSMK